MRQLVCAALVMGVVVVAACNGGPKPPMVPDPTDTSGDGGADTPAPAPAPPPAAVKK